MEPLEPGVVIPPQAVQVEETALATEDIPVEVTPPETSAPAVGPPGPASPARIGSLPSRSPTRATEVPMASQRMRPLGCSQQAAQYQVIQHHPQGPALHRPVLQRLPPQRPALHRPVLQRSIPQRAALQRSVHQRAALPRSAHQQPALQCLVLQWRSGQYTKRRSFRSNCQLHLDPRALKSRQRSLQRWGHQSLDRRRF